MVYNMVYNMVWYGNGIHIIQCTVFIMLSPRFYITRTADTGLIHLLLLRQKILPSVAHNMPAKWRELLSRIVISIAMRSWFICIH